MHRLIVALLAAFDAAIAAAVGVAATLAPLTLLWALGFGGGADWGALWPASGTVWLFGHLVPLAVALPTEYLVAAGIDAGAASFVLSLAPLAFAGFTIVFAARSGMRAARADAWITGVLTGSAVFAGLTAAVALTARTGIAETQTWQAILFPSLLFAVPALAAALVVEWIEVGAGAVARLRDRVESAPRGWGEAPGLIARGAAVVVVGLLGAGALLTAAALLAGAGEIVALYETAGVDAVGATVVTLGQLAYLPTLVVWAVAFLAGPGFALGVGTAVSPAGTQVGVVPGIPLLGVIPQTASPWLLLLALVPVALGAFAGWIARSRLVRGGRAGAAADGTGGDRAVPGGGGGAASEPFAARLAIALGIAALAAAAVALLALMASGSIGPGTLAEVGPAAGPLALTVGFEVALGAGILLLSPLPRRRDGRARAQAGDRSPADAGSPQAVRGSLQAVRESSSGVRAASPADGRAAPSPGDRAAGAASVD